MKTSEMNMIHLRFWLAVLASSALLMACAPMQSIKDAMKSKGANTLSSGVTEYEEGKYAEAVKNLQGALDLGLTTPEQIKAHKYLAFIHCISGKERQCREEFKKTLEIDPAMELEPAEAGHPIWGPVFKSVKGRKPDPKK